MIEQFGGTLNFIAVLIPCLMGLFYGCRCLFATDAFIEQYGLGAASEFMIKATGCCVGAQGIVYAILILTSPVGAWAVFAYGTIHAALFLIFGWMTVNGNGKPPKGGVEIASQLDHRLAMSFLVLGMVSDEPMKPLKL